MAVLGIVGCRIFEDEIVHIIVNDPYIDRIYIIENEENSGLLHKLEAEGFEPVILPLRKIREDLKQSNEFNVIVNLQGIDLHANPARLKSKTYSNVNLLSRLADGIILFYGLCGKAFSRIYEDLTYTGCSLEILQDSITDETAQPLEDCIAAALGSNSRYREVLKNHRDTFFLTPMWAANWKAAFRFGDDNLLGFTFIPEHLRKLGYRRVARINTKLSYEPDVEKKIEEFAINFGFEIIEMEGSIEIAQNSYNQMRNTLLKPLKA